MSDRKHLCRVGLGRRGIVALSIAIVLGISLLTGAAPSAAIDADRPPSPNIFQLSQATSAEDSFSPASLSDESESDDSGYVVLGGKRLFQLQPFAGFTGQDRADLVRNRIDDFFHPDEVGRIAEPQLEVDLDENGQSTIRLFSRSSGDRERVTLLTVTRSDAAAALASTESEVRVANISEIARKWAQLLEPALRDQWERQRAQQQRQQPLSIALGVVSVLAIGVMAFLVVKLGDRGLRHARTRALEHFSEDWDFAIDYGAVCCKWLLRGLSIGVAIHLSLEMLPILGLFQQKLYRQISHSIAAVWSIFNRPLLPNSAVTVFSIIAFFILASLIFSGAKRLSHSLKQRLLDRLVVDVGSRESIATIIKYGLTAIGGLITLPLLGIDFSSLALIAGAVGLGIGIGLQNLINNFISGIVMLFERPIQVGDFVEVDGLLGSIEYISLRATVVRTLDSINVIVPNSRFMESNVVSWSYRDSRCRLHIPVGVAYGSDPKTIEAALLKVASENTRVLKTPAPQVLFQGFGDSSLNFELLAWTLRPADHPMLISELNFAIEAEFRRQGIEIPFPQQDVRVRTSAALERLLSRQSQNGYTHDRTSMATNDDDSRSSSEQTSSDSDFE